MTTRTSHLLTTAAWAAAAGAALAQEPPAYDADWIGYDTSTADVMRWSRQLDAGDVDGDGDVDVAVVHGAVLAGLSILPNLGDGSFGAPDYHASSSGTATDDLRDVELVDLDQDGDLDAVVSNPGDFGLVGLVSIHENLGGGAFAPYVQAATGVGPYGITSADLDGDGAADVVTADAGNIGGGETVSVLRNDGAGGLLPPVGVLVGPSPQDVAAGDLDGDGDVDLAVALEDETAVVLLGAGDGASFTARTISVFPSIHAGTAGAAVALGDVDGDLDLDLVFTSTKCGFGSPDGSGAVGVLANDGAGAFAAPTRLVTPPESQGGIDLALADWNGDGRLDVASAHDFEGTWVLFAGGASGFGPAQEHAAGSGAVAVEPVDVTGDGRAEVLVLGRGSLELCVHRSELDGSYQDNEPWPFFPGGGLVLGSGLDAADVDGDGDLDLATAYERIPGGGGQSILRNAGDGSFPVQEVYDTETGAENLAFAHLDGDGAPDVLSMTSSGSLRRRMNLGDGTFGAEAIWSFAGSGPPSCDALVALDLDGDGDVDAAAVAGKTLAIRANDGSGDFGAGLLLHPLTTFGSVVGAGDVDGDGDVDFVSDTHFVGMETSLNLGGGSLGPPIPVTAEWNVQGIVLVDLDGDGVLDLVSSAAPFEDEAHPQLLVMGGWGDGGFKLPDAYLGSHEIGGSGANTGEVTLTDHDADGDLDVAVGNHHSQDVSVYENQGDGTFAPQLRYGTGGESFGTAAGDFDLDGDEDLAVGVSLGLALDVFPAAVVLPSSGGGAWKDLGSALAGGAGPPALHATPLVATVPVTIGLTGAAPAAPGAIVAGSALQPLPLFGGTLLPALDEILPIVTDGAGAASFTAPWPATLPPGTTVWVQAGVLDSGAPQGVALSNALAGKQL